MTIRIVILAAGIGSRLARSLPKPLTELRDGRSILRQQFDNLDLCFADDYRVTIVVGYKLQSIIEEFPDASFVYNELYDQTNTSKSLLKALKSSEDGGVLWMNGDVVFDPEILNLAKPRILSDESFVLVNQLAVGDEEMKYELDDKGYISRLSKQLSTSAGEAIGINYVSSQDKASLIDCLEKTENEDYFEKAIEMAVKENRLRFLAIHLNELKAIEIDFEEDLREVNETF